MKRCKRTAALACALALLAALALPTATAVETVYFTSVNDTLLELSDETMLFLQDGELYVAYTAFYSTSIGTTYSRSRDKTAIYLSRLRRILVFDLATGITYDNAERDVPLDGHVIVRGDVVFLPLGMLADFFTLDYSCTKVSCGYLVRIKNEKVVLSDAVFIDAASSLMEQRYAQYERAHQPVEPVEPPPTQPTVPTTPAQPVTPPATPATPTTPTQPTTPPAQPTKQEREASEVYLLFAATEQAASVETTLTARGVRAAFLFAPGDIPARGDLARRLAATGQAIGLAPDAADADELLRVLAEANDALWTAANVRTRLVYLRGVPDETVHAVREAGYCPLRVDADCSGTASADLAAERILRQVERTPERVCRAWLGERSGAVCARLCTLLSDENAALLRLNERSA